MTPAELAAEARAKVVRVTTLLEIPTAESLDRCTGELAVAWAHIQELKTKSPEPALKPALSELRKDLRRAGLLLRRAWEFRAGLRGEAGYTRTGERTTPPASSRWALEG
jgi:hypothetical protein